MSALNQRAAKFARTRLFLAEPDDGYMVKSVAARALADEFCEYDADPAFDANGNKKGCNLHARAMAIGVAKLIAAGEVVPELSKGGVLFVRLSPKGVLAPLEWSSLPGWFDSRPGLVEWAQSCTSDTAQRVAGRWNEVVR